jgi:hypothetical protein
MSLPIDTKYIRLISSRLRNFKQKDANLFNASCCFCGDSQKNKSKARMYIYEGKGGLQVKCHNCGISTNASNLIKHLDSSLFKEYTLERYKSGETNNAYTANTILNISAPRFDRVKKQTQFEYAESISDLPAGHFCLTYIQKRKIPEKFYKELYFTTNYEKFIRKLIPTCDKELVPDARLIIPFYDQYNELIAVTGRSLESGSKVLRYVTVRTNDSKEKLLYGMNTVDLNEPVKIVEGQIDSLFLSNCVASGDANLSIAANELIKRGVKKESIILCPDREPRNREIVKLINNFIKEEYKVCLFPNHMIGKDINEHIINGLSQSDIENIILNNTYEGIKLQMEFIRWKKI